MKLHRISLLISLALTLPVACVATAATEDEALAMLAVTTEQKAKAIVELSQRGTAKCVPALVTCLADRDLHDYARNALELIPDPAVGPALIAALGKLTGNPLVGVVITLGDRREKAAVPALVKLAADPKGPAFDAALSSLALIASDEAGAAIAGLVKTGPAETKLAAVHAALRAAQRMAKGSAPRMALVEAVQGADVPAHVKSAADALK